MNDLNSLTSIEPTVLSQGIRFLYSQAGELLARRRDRRDRERASAPEATDLPTASVDDPSIEGGPIATRGAIVPESAETMIRVFCDHLRPYAEGIAPVDQQDETLVGVVDALRRLLEVICEQPITFVGEHRGAMVGEVNVDDVLGYAAGIRARLPPDGELKAKASAQRVHPGGELIGLDLSSEAGE